MTSDSERVSEVRSTWVVRLSTRLIVWNTLLHLVQLILNAWDGQATHLLGIGGQWFLSTCLLGAAYLFAGSRSVRGPVSAVIAALAGVSVYVTTVAFNFANDFHWHFFGVPFTVSRLIEGGTRLFVYSAPSEEVTAVWDAFLYAEAALGALALVAMTLPLAARLQAALVGPAVRRLALAPFAAGLLLFSLNTTGREDTLWGFVARSHLFQDTNVSLLGLHHPLRHELPEASFEPVSLRRLAADRPRPNILILEFEAVGAMYLRRFEPLHGRAMEHFDRLARTSMVAERHYSVNGGSSAGSDWSLLTGLYPPNFGETPFYQDAWLKQKSLFSYAKQEGYVTGGFYAGDSDYREYYKLFRHPEADVFVDRNSQELRILSERLSAEEAAMTLMLRRVDAIDDAPFMFFLRTANAHWPYTEGAAAETDETLERYHFQLQENDRLLGRIVAELKDRGLWENTILVVTADHGEAFRQHEALHTHTVGVYEELVRVPLLISYPELIPRQWSIDVATSHVDVLRTVAALAGFAAKDLGETEGYSLVHSLPDDRVVFLSNGDDGSISGVVQGRYKLILKQYEDETMLFDLDSDPLERADLVDELPVVRDRLRDLETRWETHRRRGIGASRYLSERRPSGSRVVLSSNANVEVFLNGNAIAELHRVERGALPIRVRSGHNVLAIYGVSADDTATTELRVQLEVEGRTIGTGPWWRLSDSPQLIGTRRWLAEDVSPADWVRPVVVNKRSRLFAGGRFADWIELDHRVPFVLRLDFEVVDGALDSEQVRIRARDGFRWLVDGQLFGRGYAGEYPRTFTFDFPRQRDATQEVVVEVWGSAAGRGLLMDGTVGGREVASRRVNWEVIGGITYNRWRAVPGDTQTMLAWLPSRTNEEARVYGSWSAGARWIWTPLENQGRALFRFVPDGWSLGKRDPA